MLSTVSTHTINILRNWMAGRRNRNTKIGWTVEVTNSLTIRRKHTWRSCARDRQNLIGSISPPKLTVSLRAGAEVPSSAGKDFTTISDTTTRMPLILPGKKKKMLYFCRLILKLALNGPKSLREYQGGNSFL